jgi:hypothetical protein
MDLNLQRTVFTKKSTIGPLIIDGELECFILEPPWRNNQTDVSCIPAGRYRISLYLSPSRRYVVALLHDVPGRKEIEIHIGNWPKDTKGCLLPGRTAGLNYVSQSGIAFNILIAKIKKALDAREEVWINIMGGQDEIYAQNPDSDHDHVDSGDGQLHGPHLHRAKDGLLGCGP